MGNSKHMLFWGFITFLPVGCSARTTKIDLPDAIPEMTAFVIVVLELWTLIRGELRANSVLFMAARLTAIGRRGAGEFYNRFGEHFLILKN